ncbi:MAG TPA: hypothetical protein VJ843_02005 [Candidatus Saccharimonadales bacterium]|nr:hypothetical protein [Candidatus Saccharimonadales bacterium]
MTNVIHTFMGRRQAALAESAAAAWEEICGDYDPSQKGDGNYDAAMRRENSVTATGAIAVGEVVYLDPAQGLPHIPHQEFWDVADRTENAAVIFPKGVWGAEA